MAKHSLGACSLCHSTKYYRQAGTVVCENGHESRAYSDERVELDPNVVVRHIKKRKKPKRVKQEPKKDEPDKKALTFVILCFQEVLQGFVGQVDKLVAVGNELEEVVKDLWMYYISFLETVMKSLEISDDDVVEVHLIGKQALDAPIRNQTVLRLSLRSLVGLVYSGCCYLRVPVIARDFVDWIIQNKLFYANAYTLLSDDTLTKLTRKQYSKYVRSFRPRSLPLAEMLERFHLNLVLGLKHEFQVLFPPINVVGWVFRFVSALCLPVQFYHFTMRIIELSGLEIVVESDRHLPAARIMGFVVFAVKLMFGLNFRNGDLQRTGFFQQFFPTFEQIKDAWNANGLFDKFIYPWDADNLKDFCKHQFDEYLEFCRLQIVRSGTFQKEQAAFQKYLKNSQGTMDSSSCSCTTSRPPLATSSFLAAENKDYIQGGNNKEFASKHYISYHTSESLPSFHPEYRMLLIAACHVMGWKNYEHLQQVVRCIEGHLDSVGEMDKLLY